MIDVVLLEPESPGNIGSIARVMKNFGFLRLVIVNPKCNHLDSMAIKMSMHGKDILENASVMGDFGNYDYLVATSARLGRDYNITRSPLTAEKFATRISEFKDTRVGLLIGRESSGLTNAEIEKCDFLVNIPASEEYNTLNISHALTVILYEIYKNWNDNDRLIPIGDDEKRVILDRVNSILDKVHFTTADKRETQIKFWKRLLGKSFLTKRESYAMLGFLKKIDDRL